MTDKQDNSFPLVLVGEIGGVSSPTVNARDLHTFLEVGTAFKDWIARRVADYGFIDGTDFCSFLSETTNGGRPAKEYHISLDMAKELSMVERNEKGKQARQYFIGMERLAKSQQMPAIPAASLEQIERSFGIIRSLIHKVTEIEKALPGIVLEMLEPAIAARLAEKNMLIRRGKTAKQIWDAAGMPPKIKGVTVWFGKRLEEMGCASGKADRGDGAIRLFDPDKAEICMRNGLSHRSKVYASERMGQGQFRLVTK